MLQRTQPHDRSQRRFPLVYLLATAFWLAVSSSVWPQEDAVYGGPDPGMGPVAGLTLEDGNDLEPVTPKVIVPDTIPRLDTVPGPVTGPTWLDRYALEPIVTPAPMPDPRTYGQEIPRDRLPTPPAGYVPPGPQTRAAGGRTEQDTEATNGDEEDPGSVVAQADASMRVAHDRAWAAYYEHLLVYYDSKSGSLDHRSRAFTQQHVMTIIIAVAVHALLVFALVTARREFAHAAEIRAQAREMRQGTRAESAEDMPAAPEPATEVHEISLSLQGMSLKTSMHGVLLMAMSLAFYFLYLKFVYPLSVVGN